MARTIEQEWQVLFEQIFADFPDDRILQEARTTLRAMGYRLHGDDREEPLEIPQDVSLLVIRRSLHRDTDTLHGGYLTFDVGLGPHFTDLGRFSGLCEYGVLHLEFGLDGAFRDEQFEVSPLHEPAAVFEAVPLSAVAESGDEYQA